MNRFGLQRRNTKEMYRPTNMAAKLSERDIFTKANAPICELTNKSAATLGNRKSIILITKQGLFLLFTWRTFSFRKYKFHTLISKFKIKLYQIKLSPCPHVSGIFFFLNYFFVDAKIFASTRSIFESFPAIHMYPIVSGNFLICSSAQFFCQRESWNEHAHNSNLGAISFAP